MEESTNQSVQRGQKKSFHRLLRNKKVILAVLSVLILLFGINFFLYVRDQWSVPEENVFYQGKYHGSPVLFYRQGNLLISGIASDPHLGDFVHYDKPFHSHMHDIAPIDFREVNNARKLFTFERYATIESLMLSEDQNYLMISFVGGEQDNINYLYHINLKTTESKKVGEHTLGEGSAPYNGGFTHILAFVPNQYVVFDIKKGDGPPAGVIVKNIQSGKEQNLGVVGDTKIDLSAKSVSFKKIAEVQVPCEEKDPACFATDTYKKVYQPAGQLLNQPLP